MRLSTFSTELLWSLNFLRCLAIYYCVQRLSAAGIYYRNIENNDLLTNTSQRSLEFNEANVCSPFP